MRGASRSETYLSSAGLGSNSPCASSRGAVRMVSAGGSIALLGLAGACFAVIPSGTLITIRAGRIQR